MQLSTSENEGFTGVLLHEEVERRYLAYALSTIVSRALPDVRDGLKPVHRRILYAMQGMGIVDTARMRKSAAVVGEVIGKYHPHGDQAAYDSLVRMAQDFSLRYPLVDGSGNFGSVDGDSAAAMRYTEVRLSGFATTLLREIDQGTTEFNPTYDAMGSEPEILPAMVPNLLLNGSSGIAVGMSCSFPPHNLTEVVTACRAAIADPSLDTRGLLKHIKGPDFPTGGEILRQPEELGEIYSSGHGAIMVRGSFEVEELKRGRRNIIITSIPYSVNKSRLIERIAHLIREKRLKQIHDVRDESAKDVRVVLELKGSDINIDAVMAYVFKHTDLQINFPINFIAVTEQGAPERLSLEQIIRSFLRFRLDTITKRLKHRLEILERRIHILEGFAALFLDLDRAIEIIRSASSRAEAAEGLKTNFGLDDEQVNAILELRLYRLVGLEMDKLLGELAEKKKEADEIRRDLASSSRLWNIVDRELAEIGKKFGDRRRTAIVEPKAAAAVEYNPEIYVDHEDVTVILSKQCWLRRVKMEVEDPSSLKFRDGDDLFAIARVNTERTVAFFSNLGKVYVMRVLDVPATSGFGEPLGSLINLIDGEYIVGFIAPDPAAPILTQKPEELNVEDVEPDDDFMDTPEQPSLFDRPDEPDGTDEIVDSVEAPVVTRGLVATRLGKGFRFEYELLRETTKRGGRRLATLVQGDEVVTVVPESGELLVVATDSGKMLVFPVEQVAVLAGPGRGVQLIKLVKGAVVKGILAADPESRIVVSTRRGKEKEALARDLPQANRATQGKNFAQKIAGMRLVD